MLLLLTIKNIMLKQQKFVKLTKFLVNIELVETLLKNKLYSWKLLVIWNNCAKLTAP